MANAPLFTPISSGSSSGGGGGGSLQWLEDASAPTSATENQSLVYLYQAALAQNLYCDIKVPSTYSAGSPIALKLSYYSPDASGTGLLLTQSTLIRTGTDAVTSTTNQRTSTNAAVTFTNANRLLTVSFDVTDSTGKVNAVSVSANDIIKIRLYRDTDSATSDIRALVYGAEVTFS